MTTVKQAVKASESIDQENQNTDALVKALKEKLGLEPKIVTTETFEKVAAATDALLEAAEAAGFTMFITGSSRNSEDSFGLIHSNCISDVLFDEESPTVLKIVAALSRVESLMREEIDFHVSMSIEGRTVLSIGKNPFNEASEEKVH